MLSFTCVVHLYSHRGGEVLQHEFSNVGGRGRDNGQRDCHMTGIHKLDPIDPLKFFFTFFFSLAQSDFTVHC